MVRRSFRIGLRLGILLGVFVAVFKVVQSRRSADPPSSDSWTPPRPDDSASGSKASSVHQQTASTVDAPARRPLDEVGEPIQGVDPTAAASASASKPSAAVDAKPVPEQPAPAKPSTASKAAASAASTPSKASSKKAGAKMPSAKKSGAKKTAKSATGRGWVEPVGDTCPTSHPLKAKLSSKIFHRPGMLNYDRTNPDRCYADDAAAESDGLRAAKR
ncbi:MAG: hypothetical protein ACR2H3_06995 [Acidimicrobiales bacterium]